MREEKNELYHLHKLYDKMWIYYEYWIRKGRELTSEEKESISSYLQDLDMLRIKSDLLIGCKAAGSSFLSDKFTCDMLIELIRYVFDAFPVMYKLFCNAFANSSSRGQNAFLDLLDMDEHYRCAIFEYYRFLGKHFEYIDKITEARLEWEESSSEFGSTKTLCNLDTGETIFSSMGIFVPSEFLPKQELPDKNRGETAPQPNEKEAAPKSKKNKKSETAPPPEATPAPAEEDKSGVEEEKKDEKEEINEEDEAEVFKIIELDFLAPDADPEEAYRALKSLSPGDIETVKNTFVDAAKENKFYEYLTEKGSLARMIENVEDMKRIWNHDLNRAETTEVVVLEGILEVSIEIKECGYLTTGESNRIIKKPLFEVKIPRLLDDEYLPKSVRELFIDNALGISIPDEKMWLFIEENKEFLCRLRLAADMSRKELAEMCWEMGLKTRNINKKWPIQWLSEEEYQALPGEKDGDNVKYRFSDEPLKEGERYEPMYLPVSIEYKTNGRSYLAFNEWAVTRHIAENDIEELAWFSSEEDRKEAAALVKIACEALSSGSEMSIEEDGGMKKILAKLAGKGPGKHRSLLRLLLFDLWGLELIYPVDAAGKENENEDECDTAPIPIELTEIGKNGVIECKMCGVKRKKDREVLIRAKLKKYRYDPRSKIEKIKLAIERIVKGNPNAEAREMMNLIGSWEKVNALLEIKDITGLEIWDKGKRVVEVLLAREPKECFDRLHETRGSELEGLSMESFYKEWQNTIERLREKQVQKISVQTGTRAAQKGWELTNTEKKYDRAKKHIIYEVVMSGIEVEGKIVRAPVVNVWE